MEILSVFSDIQNIIHYNNQQQKQTFYHFKRRLPVWNSQRISEFNGIFFFHFNRLVQSFSCSANFSRSLILLYEQLIIKMIQRASQISWKKC